VQQVYGLTGAGQVIGHADTGLDLGDLTALHPDLRGRVKAAYAWGRRAASGFDSPGSDPMGLAWDGTDLWVSDPWFDQIFKLNLGLTPPGDWSDPNGHGTHTAGSILGDGSASGGQYKGTAPDAELVHQSVMDFSGHLHGIPLDVGDLFSQAYDDVESTSLAVANLMAEDGSVTASQRCKPVALDPKDVTLAAVGDFSSPLIACSEQGGCAQPSVAGRPTDIHPLHHEHGHGGPACHHRRHVALWDRARADVRRKTVRAR
jgi:hypothetical protein